jgi:hypothetical protein
LKLMLLLIRVLWYPTQAKVRLEWGTQPSLLVKHKRKDGLSCNID